LIINGSLALFYKKAFLSFFKDIMNNYSLKNLPCLALVALIYSSLSIADIHRDLELDKILASVNRTQTVYGKQRLQELLAKPIADVSSLRQRQASIAYLNHHTAYHADIISALKNIHHREHMFSKLYTQASSVEDAALEKFYFTGETSKQWNYNPTALHVGQLLHVANLMSSSAQHCLMWFFFRLALGEEKHICPSCPINRDEHHDHHHHHHDDHDHHKHGKHSHDKPKPNSTIETIKNILFAWHTLAFFQELYSAYTTARDEVQIIKQLQQELIDVAHGLNDIKTLHTLLQDHPDFASHIALHKNLDALCLHINVSEKLHTLLELLKTSAFKANASCISSAGTILAAYKLLQEVAHELEPALQAIGEIDACSSCALLLQEHNTGPFQYSFAEYTPEASTPAIETTAFWHPLMNSHAITLNSISLGTEQCARNALLTGPNACGKSTNLKLLTLCVYLAQTLSIVPAEHHLQPLFKEIYSSMVITDQLQQGKSLFITELENAHALLERVENLAPHEYIFVAFDELFKSTHHEKGQKVAYQLLKKLYNHPQVITITTTHFQELTNLAQRNKMLCTNYTLDNFKLIPGIGACIDNDDDNYFG
jgi:hypothetical protein